MIIIRFMGGLGNQLFQYALYKKMISQGKEVYADIEYIEKVKKNYGDKTRKDMAQNVRYGLENLGIKLNVMNSRKSIYSYTGSRKHISGLVSRYITHKTKLIEESKISSCICFHPEILDIDDGYLDGYWQSEKYFKDIKNTIYEEIKFKTLIDEKNTNILNEMLNTFSVSVHVRRGDYLSPEVRALVGDICTEDYYRRAIDYFLSLNSDSTFFFFSNDKEWTKNAFGNDLKNAYYIDWNVGYYDYYDMYLMSRCKNNIIANSSFSWWGAWLNHNDDKVVVSPDRWVNNEDRPDVICPEWVKMQG